MTEVLFPWNGEDMDLPKLEGKKLQQKPKPTKTKPNHRLCGSEEGLGVWGVKNSFLWFQEAVVAVLLPSAPWHHPVPAALQKSMAQFKDQDALISNALKYALNLNIQTIPLNSMAALMELKISLLLSAFIRSRSNYLLSMSSSRGTRVFAVWVSKLKKNSLHFWFM